MNRVLHHLIRSVHMEVGRAFLTALLSGILLPALAVAQIEMEGFVLQERFPGSGENMPFTAIRVYASPDGAKGQTLTFGTWEVMQPGWYRLIGPAGRYTVLFTGPAKFMRPMVLTNVFTRNGDVINRTLTPQFDFHNYHEGSWDENPATDYYQTFVAKGTSVTQVGFRVVHDGIDGVGPGSQNILVSIHEAGAGTPETWKQIGPTLPVLNVDSGGPKNYLWSVGWDSGEIPLVPGKTYAVHLRTEEEGRHFQAFWREDDDKTADCYRLGPAGPQGFQGHDLWLAVGTDGDGLLIPYNKRVHQEFGPGGGWARKWSQTYVAQGKSMAGAVLYIALSGAQPGLPRQRCAVRVRRGGPDGPVVGVEKIATGNGNYTGDASWGTFGAAYAPGEVPLVPGETYAVEFESIENTYTLVGFYNIKGETSDGQPGFTPYPKVPPDDYPHGTAYFNGTDAKDFDLDMQILEYAHSGEGWEQEVDAENLLQNGDMESGTIVEGNFDASHPDGWRKFAIDEGTAFWYCGDEQTEGNMIVRVIGGSISGRTVDGGYVQRVTGLSHADTYRISGKVRSSWVLDTDHQCFVGYDVTGQDKDPLAKTVTWEPLPSIHGAFVPFESDPVRPATGEISVWLRGRTTLTVDLPFKADFDDFSLRRVTTGVPTAQ